MEKFERARIKKKKIGNRNYQFIYENLGGKEN